MRTATEPVFHYTDAGGLLGMVQRRVLWASEAAGMNDRAEVRQGWEKIRTWLKNQPDSDAVDVLRGFAKDPLRGSHEVFVLSASTRADDANQWRLYAKGGRGYAVEFDPTEPLVVLTDEPIEDWKPGRVSFGAATSVVEVGPWMHVLYTDLEVETALDALVRQIEADTESICTSSADRDYQDRALEDVGERAYSDLAGIAHLIKEPGFAGESEVRVVVTFFWAAKHIQYRAGAYGVVGYTELGRSPDSKPRGWVVAKDDAVRPLPIRSVRLGPLLHEEHCASVRSFLRNHDLRDVAVEGSKVPLR